MLCCGVVAVRCGTVRNAAAVQTAVNKASQRKLKATRLRAPRAPASIVDSGIRNHQRLLPWRCSALCVVLAPPLGPEHTRASFPILQSAWMDVLSVSRNTEVLLAAEAEALKKQILTQTGEECPVSGT